MSLRLYQPPNFHSSVPVLAKIVAVKIKVGSVIDHNQILQYFPPLGQNHPSINGLVFSDAHSLVLIQIALTIEHEIKADGIRELSKALPTTIFNIYITFVIPENCIEHYAKSQSISLLPKPQGVQVKLFHLIFTDKIMQAVSVQSAFQLEEGNMSEYGWRI